MGFTTLSLDKSCEGDLQENSGFGTCAFFNHTCRDVKVSVRMMQRLIGSMWLERNDSSMPKDRDRNSRLQAESMRSALNHKIFWNSLHRKNLQLQVQKTWMGRQEASSQKIRAPF